MEELIKSLKECHANTFVMYFKAHAFHWNVEGIHFPTYHEFFGNLYEELYGAIDPMAEEIRTLGAYAPTSLNSLYESATIAESTLQGNSLNQMLGELNIDNDSILSCLSKSFELASAINNQGLADFISGRLDAHKKHSWMIKSCLKDT